MKGFDRLSHAYITDGQMADDLAMAIVCTTPSTVSFYDTDDGAASGADGTNGTGNGTNGTTTTTNKPCRRCKDCLKAEKGMHPDIIAIERQKDKRSILVDQIRALKKDVYILPNDCARKVYIINDAETMNVNAQNAFLQILEEPPAHAAFILKTSNPALLLKTVRSRCVDLKTQPKPTDTGEDFPEIKQLASDFVAALDDNLQLTKCMFRLDKLDKPTFTVFITHAREQLLKQTFFNETRTLRPPHPLPEENPALRNETENPPRNDPRRKKAILADDLLDKALEMLELNVNTGHISGMLCASLMNVAS